MAELDSDAGSDEVVLTPAQLICSLEEVRPGKSWGDFEKRGVGGKRAPCSAGFAMQFLH